MPAENKPAAKRYVFSPTSLGNPEGVIEAFRQVGEGFDELFDGEGRFKFANGIESGGFFHPSGISTVLTLEPGQMFLVWSHPKNYGAGDDRHGQFAIVGAYSGTSAFALNLRTGIIGWFAVSGLDVQYDGDFGIPATTISWLRLS